MKINLKITILLGFFAAVFMFLHFLPDGATALPRRPLGEFPAVIGEWKMANAHQMDDKIMNVLKVDDYIMRNYRDAGQHQINLYIGYFAHQTQGKAIHSPRQCMPGAGWTPLVMERAEIGLDPGGNRKIQVQKMLMGKGSDRQWCIFWYHGRGRIHGSEYLNKLYLILDAATQRRTDGALVRVILNAGSNPDKSLETVDQFIRAIVPGLDSYIPG